MSNRFRLEDDSFAPIPELPEFTGGLHMGASIVETLNELVRRENHRVQISRERAAGWLRTPAAAMTDTD